MPPSLDPYSPQNIGLTIALQNLQYQSQVYGGADTPPMWFLIALLGILVPLVLFVVLMVIDVFTDLRYNLLDNVFETIESIFAHTYDGIRAVYRWALRRR